MPDYLLYIAGLSTALVLTVIALSDRRALFFLAFAAPFVPIAYLNRYYFRVPAGAKWLPFACILLAGIGAAMLLPRTKAQIPRSLLLAYAALLAVFGASAVVNGTTLPALLVSQRGFLVLFGAMLALKAGYGIYDKDRLYSFLVYTGLLSCAVSVAQRLLVVPGALSRNAGDRVTGLFSVGYISMFFHLTCITIVIAYWLQGRQVVRWRAGPVLLAFVVALGVANQKAAVFYLIGMIGFLFWTSGLKQNLRAQWKLVVAAAALPALFLIVFAPIYDRNYQSRSSIAESITDPEFLQRYLVGTDNENTQFTPSGRLIRGRAISFAYELISADRLKLLLGFGPGASSESNLPGAFGPLARRYAGYEIDRNALGMILADTGFLGLAVQLFFLATIYRWKPPAGFPPEQFEHRQIRRVVVGLFVAFFVYKNMSYVPISGLLVAVLLYPTSAVRSDSPYPEPITHAR